MKCHNLKDDGTACNACVHCGDKIPNNKDSCQREDCGISIKTLVSFPWTKCEGCEKYLLSFDWSIDLTTWILLGVILALFLIGGITSWLARTQTVEAIAANFIISGFVLLFAAIIVYISLSIKPRKMWWVMWQPFAGILLMLTGLLFIPSIWFFVGLILAVTWFFSQRCRKTIFDLNSKELRSALDRDMFENSHPEPRCTDDKEKLDAMNNEVIALTWKINHLLSWRWLIQMAGFTAIVVIMLFLGPGEFLGRDIISSKIKFQADRIKAITRPIVEDVNDLGRNARKRYLVDQFVQDGYERKDISAFLKIALAIYEIKLPLFSSGNKVYVQVEKDLSTVKKLVKDNELTVEQIYQLADEANCGVENIYNEVQNFSDKGVDLFNALRIQFNNRKIATDVKSTPLIISILLNYFKNLRKKVWVLELILVFLLIIADGFFFGLSVISSIGHKIYTAGDEVKGRIGYAWLKAEDKIKERQAIAQNRPHTPDSKLTGLKNKLKSKDLSWLDVVGIYVIMKIGQLLINRFYPNANSK